MQTHMRTAAASLGTVARSQQSSSCTSGFCARCWGPPWQASSCSAPLGARPARHGSWAARCGGRWQGSRTRCICCSSSECSSWTSHSCAGSAAHSAACRFGSAFSFATSGSRSSSWVPWLWLCSTTSWWSTRAWRWGGGWLRSSRSTGFWGSSRHRPMARHSATAVAAGPLYWTWRWGRRPVPRRPPRVPRRAPPRHTARPRLHRWPRGVANRPGLRMPRLLRASRRTPGTTTKTRAKGRRLSCRRIARAADAAAAPDVDITVYSRDLIE
mmetsp:Transcript_60419/g.152948  ORF Transcript_60419/g.152948 Transcript_60419/m.152948 type:complete len:270 (+) Transcript_60419:354-1163(+)